jgi:hypothetical protein
LRQKSAFAGIGETDQTTVGNQLQFKIELSLFSRLPRRAFGWGLIGGGDEIQVPQPTTAPFGRFESLAHFHQISQLVALVISNDRANWYEDFQVFRRGTKAISTATVCTVCGPEVWSVHEVGELIQRGIRHQPDRAATSTISTIGPPFGDKHFPAHR